MLPSSGPSTLHRRADRRRAVSLAALFGLASGLALTLSPGAISGSSGSNGKCQDDRGTCDQDQDGLPDLVEDALGSNSRAFDTDGDRMADGREVAMGLSPVIPEPWEPPRASVKLDFIPDGGGIRFSATVCSPRGFPADSRILVLLGIDDKIYDRTEQFAAIGWTYRSCDAITRGYLSTPVPLEFLRRRFSMAVVLAEEGGIVLDEALVGVRQSHFYRTDMSEQSDGTFAGSTVFYGMGGEHEGEDGGFFPDEDCKQSFSRVTPSVKVITEEKCIERVSRYCPDDCGKDVGQRVVCIGSAIQ